MALVPIQDQLDPAATTLTLLFSASSVGAARVIATNRSVTDTTIRIQHRLLGAASDDKQYLAYDLALPGNETFLSPTITLANTDEVWVYTNDATVSFAIEGLAY